MNRFIHRSLGCVLGLFLWSCSGKVDTFSAADHRPQDALFDEAHPPCTDRQKCCPAEKTECSGDPDQAVACKCSYLWDCRENPSKCEQDFPTPPGSPDGGGGWSCLWKKSSYSCTKPGKKDAPPQGKGSSNWSYRWNEPDSSWEATRNAIPNPTNSAEGLGRWDCATENTRLVCHKIVTSTTGAKNTIGGGPQNCQGDQFAAKTRLTPDILILLDRSNSMSEQKLWPVITSALKEVTMSMNQSINFGLMVFPHCQDEEDHEGACRPPSSSLISIAPHTATQISSALDRIRTCGGTPTASSLLSAHEYLKAGITNHPQYLLLATDGGPNCNQALNPSSCRSTDLYSLYHGHDAEACLDDQQTYRALDALLANNIRTYVLGMGGASHFGDVLGAMAQHGGTETHFMANDPSSMKAALEKITGTIALCEFHLACAKIPDVQHVNFFFEGTAVPQSSSHERGWDWSKKCTSGSDTAIVRFFGEDCDLLMSHKVKSISANFCP
jgi:hypothetical protein